MNWEEFNTDDGVRFSLVGWPRKKKDGPPYIRFENKDGVYLGCIEERNLKQLQTWITRVHQELKNLADEKANRRRK